MNNKQFIRATSKRSLLLFVSLYSLLCWLNQVLFYDALSGDSIRYITLADQYAAGNFKDPHTNCFGHPFYSFFLLITSRVFFYHPYFIGLIQSLLFAVSAVLLLRELEKYYQRPLGGLLILIFLVPEFQIFNGYVLTEALGLSLVLLSYYLVLKICNDGIKTKKIFLLSFVLGSSVLNRLESIVLLIPLLYFLFPFIKSQMSKYVLLLLSVPLVFVSLNSWRNYVIYNRFNPGSFNSGEVLYGGNNPRLDGSHHNFWMAPEVFFDEKQRQELNEITTRSVCESCPQRSDFLTAQAKEAWRNDALGQLRTVPLKLAKNWLLPGFFDIYTADLSGSRDLQLQKLFDKKSFNNKWYAPVKHGFYLVIHWCLLGLIFAGMFRMSTADGFRRSVLVLFFIFLLFAFPFCGLPRWHLLIFPLLLIAFCPPKVVSFLNGCYGFVVARLDK